MPTRTKSYTVVHTTLLSLPRFQVDISEIDMCSIKAVAGSLDRKLGTPPQPQVPLCHEKKKIMTSAA